MVIVERKPSAEQLNQIRRLAVKEIRLFETRQYHLQYQSEPKDEERDFLFAKSVENNLSKLEAEIQTFGICPEDLEVIVAEYCRVAAILRIAALLEVRCAECEAVADCDDVQTPPALCASFAPCWNAHNFDEFGRDKGNLVMVKILAHKFL